MPDDSLITEQLLQALAMRESGGRQDVIGDRHLTNPAYGMYQVRKPAYLDVVQRRPEYAGIPFEDVQRDQALNETFAKAYLSVLSNEYGLDSLEEILAGFKAGPTTTRQGIMTPATQQYIQDIKALMQKGP